MERMKTSLAGLALAVLLAGCAASGPLQGTLTYETVPEGAQLFEGSKPIGTAPVTRSYAGDGKSPVIRTPEVTAVWPSGAKATFWTNLAPRDDRVATIDRPANTPGLQADLDAAAPFKLAREKEQRKETEEARRAQVRDSARCKAAQQGNKTLSVLDKADCF